MFGPKLFLILSISTLALASKKKQQQQQQQQQQVAAQQKMVAVSKMDVACPPPQPANCGAGMGPLKDGVCVRCSELGPGVNTCDPNYYGLIESCVGGFTFESECGKNLCYTCGVGQYSVTPSTGNSCLKCTDQAGVATCDYRGGGAFTCNSGYTLVKAHPRDSTGICGNYFYPDNGPPPQGANPTTTFPCSALFATSCTSSGTVTQCLPGYTANAADGGACEYTTCPADT